MSLIFLQRLAIVAEIACPAVKLKDVERRLARVMHISGHVRPKLMVMT